MKTYVYSKPYKQKIIAILFIIAKRWKELKCPPTAKCGIYVCVYVCVCVCDSAIKSNEDTTSLNFENIMLGERSQSQRTTFCIITYT